MADALGNSAPRRHDVSCGAMTAGLPSPAAHGAGRRQRGASARDGKKKMAPERSASQNPPALRSGARWQSERGRLPPSVHALQGKRRE